MLYIWIEWLALLYTRLHGINMTLFPPYTWGNRSLTWLSNGHFIIQALRFNYTGRHLKIKYSFRSIKGITMIKLRNMNEVYYPNPATTVCSAGHSQNCYLIKYSLL